MPLAAASPPQADCPHPLEKGFSFSWLWAQCVDAAPLAASEITLPWPLRGCGGKGEALDLKPQGWVLFPASEGRRYSSLIAFIVLKFSVDNAPQLPAHAYSSHCFLPWRRQYYSSRATGLQFPHLKSEKNAPCWPYRIVSRVKWVWEWNSYIIVIVICNFISDILYK